ncbi:MAG: 1-deoxy-D-xylulose-5-phosphate synthase [candidate division Zixibacteria bacterium SM23_73_2]|nr:MAG: 1-deoxy-D-xylulose-5-phosphate synthase [candidate division Zixibacteria bacterium SM23_73_2]
MENILDKINSPEDLKKIPIEKLPELAQEIREKIITVVSKTGGHLASNLGAVELTLALHYVYDSPQDKIFWDVGHQCYTHKLLTGRKDRFDTIRTYQGISGFPKRAETEHDPFDVGHACTSISSALGVACARDLLGEEFSVIAVVGDGALSGGLSFEGLNNAGAQKKDFIVILNDNSMFISKNVGAMAKYLTHLLTDEKYNKLKAEVWDLVGRFKRRDKIRAMVQQVEESVKGFLVPGIIFEKLGFRYLGPIDGHDLPQLIKTLSHIKTLKGPIFLHILTKKGKGYKYAEEDAPRFHGIGSFDKVTGDSNSTRKNKAYTDVFSEAMVEIGEMDDKVIGITAAMSLGTGLFSFSQRFAQRFFDVGIAEQHGATFSAGLARQGLKPVFAVYSTFLQRAFDQVIHDIALQNLPVTFAIDRAGLVGEDGPTHHGFFDLSYLRGIPNLVIASPKDGKELRDLLYTAVNWGKSPFALRYPRSSVPDQPEKKELVKIEVGTWEVLREGEDVLILATGSMVVPSLEACFELEKENYSATVVNCRFTKPLDEPLLCSLLKKHEHVLTVEENSLLGGFGSAVSEFVQKNAYKNVHLKMLGIPDRFIPHGRRDILLKDLGLDPQGIYFVVKESLKTERKRFRFLFSKQNRLK